MRKDTLLFIGLDTHKEFNEVAYSEDEYTASAQREDDLRIPRQQDWKTQYRIEKGQNFLHGNAKRTLVLIQYMLQVQVVCRPARPRPVICCPRCQTPMQIVAILRPNWSSR